MQFIAAPCLAANAASWACCAMNAAGSICCSLASCFGCRWNSKLAKLVYLVIFFASAVLGIVLRYYGQEALSSWVATIGFCKEAQCYGIQAAYRISFAVATFFVIMAVFTALVPITHLGGWLVKLLLYVLILGLSLLIPNDNMVQYAEAARAFSVIFILCQVFIILDFAYNVHDWLLAKIDAKQAEFDAANWEPGLCSNGWSVLYVLTSFFLIAASLSGLGLLFAYWGQCPLNNFYIAETLVIGLILVLLSTMNIIGRGLLTPAIVLSYNTYLVYGALTNNPDAACNRFAVSENQNQASIITGLVIAALSVTWMAYNSAGSMYKAVAREGAVHESPNPAHSASGVKDWPRDGSAPGGGAGAPKDYGAASTGATAPQLASAARYAEDEDEEDAEERSSKKSSASGGSSSNASSARARDEDTQGGVEPRPYVFHFVMFLGGCYLAMAITNWGQPSDQPNGNPELSSASMWARIGTQWAIHVVYAWTLIAPRCCPNREFS